MRVLLALTLAILPAVLFAAPTYPPDGFDLGELTASATLTEKPKQPGATALAVPAPAPSPFANSIPCVNGVRTIPLPNGKTAVVAC